jgi:prepilin-type N-terminal cleavage/methylation domain-containing protein
MADRTQLEGTAVSVQSASTRTPGSPERGFSLVETMVGLSLLLVVAAGVLPLAVLTLKITENQGHLMARATEYAEDKLEQLMALSYGDVVSDTRVFPATTTGGKGLAPGGSIDPSAPVNQYVDYLTMEGALLPSANGTPPQGWYYQRLWRVEEIRDADANCPVSASAAQKCLKQITVMAIVRAAAQGGAGFVPRATVSALKTYPF